MTLSELLTKWNAEDMKLKITPFRLIKELIPMWSLAEGKILSSVEEENANGVDFLVFRFTDDRAVLLRYYDYESGGGGYSRDPYDKFESWENTQAVYFGLKTLKEFEAEEIASAAKSKQEQEERERVTYLRLKEKFG